MTNHSPTLVERKRALSAPGSSLLLKTMKTEFFLEQISMSKRSTTSYNMMSESSKSEND